MYYPGFKEPTQKASILKILIGLIVVIIIGYGGYYMYNKAKIKQDTIFTKKEDIKQNEKKVDRLEREKKRIKELREYNEKKNIEYKAEMEKLKEMDRIKDKKKQDGDEKEKTHIPNWEYKPNSILHLPVPGSKNVDSVMECAFVCLDIPDCTVFEVNKNNIGNGYYCGVGNKLYDKSTLGNKNLTYKYMGTK